ncbi:hypothetical protein BDN70DRAFT_990607 [Pholiota conissans]|uniref:Uncharacterized protein n=1 Tax=Pholiota conissans TaxID=109636 RepID=A0A9P5Z9M0_9AGAR|nr:hypothetical protein BDN70DRAFT_990607 [Pholiota conissans]
MRRLSWFHGARISAKPISKSLLPKYTGLIAITTTMSDGDDYHVLCSELNLKEGHFKCIRLSSERSTIRVVFKELTHSLGARHLPKSLSFRGLARVAGVACVAGVAKRLLDVLAVVVKWIFWAFLGSWVLRKGFSGSMVVNIFSHNWHDLSIYCSHCELVLSLLPRLDAYQSARLQLLEAFAIHQ